MVAKCQICVWASNYFSSDSANLRVEDFGDQHVLALECMSCGGTGAITAEEIRQKYKPYERIKLLEGDFVCEHCKQFGLCHLHVEEVGLRD